MWLVNTETLALEYFISERDVKYAILSHTWELGEVLHQEFRERPEGIEHKPGYIKIKKACRQALSDGLTYAWVDTCCIDKTSSAELSEAINSMFRWYQSAMVCYVYLSDVTASEVDGASAGHEQFISSRWFTRGWTLQELIAPRRLDFFNSAWQKLGTLNSIWLQLGTWSALLDSVCIASRIDRELFTGQRKLSSFPVAVKMSWAALRVTTRTEDLGYCLMGIFSVHMPLLYGEGHKAYERLQEEIFRSTSDLSILAWENNVEVARQVWDILEPSHCDLVTCTCQSPTDPRSILVTFHANQILLAPSPLFYKAMGDLVWDPRIDSDRPCNLSNTRLELSVPWIRGRIAWGEENICILLGCRHSNIMERVPVLCLEQSYQDTNRYRIKYIRLEDLSVPLAEVAACKFFTISRGPRIPTERWVGIPLQTLPQLWLWLPPEGAIQVQKVSCPANYDHEAQTFAPAADDREFAATIWLSNADRNVVVEVVVVYDMFPHLHLDARECLKTEPPSGHISPLDDQASARRRQIAVDHLRTSGIRENIFVQTHSVLWGLWLEQPRFPGPVFLEVTFTEAP